MKVEIILNHEILEDLKEFSYLWSKVTKDGKKSEVESLESKLNLIKRTSLYSKYHYLKKVARIIQIKETCKMTALDLSKCCDNLTPKLRTLRIIFKFSSPISGAKLWVIILLSTFHTAINLKTSNWHSSIFINTGII